MKKYFIVLLTVLLLAASVTSSYALLRKDMAMVRGTITRYDKTAGELTLKLNAETVITLNVSKANVKTPLDYGKEVIAIYKTTDRTATLVKTPRK